LDSGVHDPHSIDPMHVSALRYDPPMQQSRAWYRTRAGQPAHKP
jgi:hypothetical protein